MKILVLGAGAIGGYIGGWLASVGADVTFLLRGKRLAHIREHGLTVESTHGNLHLPVKTVSAAELKPEHDLLLVACKSYDLDEAMDAAQPGLAPHGAVLPILNGMTHIDTLNQRLGRERVLGGTTRIATNLDPDGTIRALFENREIIFGEQDGTISQRVREFCDIASGARGLELEASPRIIHAMWEKLAFLGTGGTMYCLMRANLGEILRGSPEGQQIFHRLFDTVVQIAAHDGYTLSNEFIARTRKLFERRESTLASSMLRDVEAGRPSEGEHITGYLLRRCRAAGLDDTILACAYANLKAYDERRAAGRIPG
jgi:2-dehydropantoate 2-reductase